MTHSLTTSPNWYLGKVVDIAENEILAYGARGDVDILQIKTTKNTAATEQEDAGYDDKYMVESKPRLTLDVDQANHNGDDNKNNSNVSTNPNNLPSINGKECEDTTSTSCESSNSISLTAVTSDNHDNGCLKKSNRCNNNRKKQGAAKRKGLRDTGHDCVLITTLTRLHKEKVTAVRLLAIDTAVNSTTECEDVKQFSYSLFTGAEDGKVKHHQLSWRGDAFIKLPVVSSKLHSEHILPKNCKVSSLEICGEQLIIGDDKGNITGWQWKSGLINTIKLANSTISYLEFNNDSHLLAIGFRNGGISIYNPQTRQTVLKLKGHDDEIQALRWRPSWLDGQHRIAGQLVSGSKDRSLKLWDITTRHCVTTGKIPNSYASGGRNNILWLSLAWLPTGQVISGSWSGELLLWTFAWKSCKKTNLVEDGPKGHNRPVFTLSLFAGGTKLLSTSMDRNIMLWDITAVPVEKASEVKSSELTEIQAEGHIVEDDGLWSRAEKPAEIETKRTCSGTAVLVMSTFGGYCYCIRASPVDPGRLAVGVGDDVIRVWNVNDGAGPFNITNLWQGLKGKVTCLAWHPYKEGQLAFGTEDGRVGVFPAISKKSPLICGTYHQKVVYVVSWGPPPLTDDEVNEQPMKVYSVGDGVVLIHNTTKTSESASELNQLLTQVNGSLVPSKIRSEITWSHDYRQMYLGSEDGTVLVIRRSDLRCICSVNVCSKLVNSIRVQPLSDTSSTMCMAIGSNEHVVKVVDVSCINHSMAEDEPLPMISETALTLKSHKSRVTDICWSVLERHKLLSVSYDGKCVIWDTNTGTVLSEYKNQHGHLLTCQWSLLDPDLVYTGSADCSLHSWRPSLYERTAPVANKSPAEGTEEEAAPLDMVDINRLIEEKKRDLVAAESVRPVEVTMNGASGESSAAIKASQHLSKRKVGKSLFLNMTAANRRGYDGELKDLLLLQKQTTAGQSVTSCEGNEHLGLFSIDNAEDMQRFLDKEKETLLREGSYEKAACVGLWQGSVEESLQKAAAANCLSDCLVNSAAMLSYKEWYKYCRLYAQQLKGEGQTHKASTYLLYSHDVETAILWLTEDNLFREAISIARSRYPPKDSRITSLYESWVARMKRASNYEHAAKCLVSLGENRSALEVLNRRTGREAMVRSIRFALGSPDTTDDMLIICDKLTRDCLLSEDYKLIDSLCSPNVQLHPFLAWSIVTQLLGPVLSSGYSADIASYGIVSYIERHLSSHGVEIRHCRKQCSLSQSNSSSRQVEVAICERLLNLAVDTQEGITPAGKHLGEVFTMIMNMQQSALDQPSSLLTARLITLFTFPGCDVMDRLSECSFEPSHSLLDYSLYIFYLWSALTVSLSDHCTGTSHVHPTPASNSTDAAHDSTAGDTTPETLPSLISSHTYQLAFSLCNSIFLPWLDPQCMQVFKAHLDEVEMNAGTEMSTPAIDVLSLVTFVDKKNPEQGMDAKTVKCVLAMLIDTLRQLFIYMCSHGDKSHLPGLSPGRQLIKEWVLLHATCYEPGIHIDDNITRSGNTSHSIMNNSSSTDSDKLSTVDVGDAATVSASDVSGSDSVHTDSNVCPTADMTPDLTVAATRPDGDVAADTAEGTNTSETNTETSASEP